MCLVRDFGIGMADDGSKEFATPAPPRESRIPRAPAVGGWRSTGIRQRTDGVGGDEVDW